MKMLFVSNYYPPFHLGGYEMLCEEVATRMEARGHQVEVLTSDYRSTARQNEAAIHRKLRLQSDANYYRPLQVARYWFDRHTNHLIVKEVLERTKPDVIVIWGLWNLSHSVAASLELLAPTKVVYYLANEWPTEPSAHEAYWDNAPANSLAGRLFKRAFRIPVGALMHTEWRPFNLQFKHAIACSQSVLDNLGAAGVPLKHTRVIYHGIDPQPYREAARTRSPNPDNDLLRVVFVGSLVSHKGVHTAIEAFHYLGTNGEGPRASLSILGAGHPQYEEHLHDLVERWELQNVITFHRPIPRIELPGFLAQFDVLVMPSIWEEPQARISQEAMAAGLVLVATLTGGTKEILRDGANGLAFEPEDAQGLARQLGRLLETDGLATRLANTGLQTVMERFTATRMLDELEGYLSSVIEGQQTA